MMTEDDDIEMSSSISISIPSIIDDEDKYIHLPGIDDQWKRLSLMSKSKADLLGQAQYHNDAFINLVGCLENDVDVRTIA